ncbi:hypothetical protein [Microbacterium rhizophilus]|uniref:hypothetical protein n=1 Tax=Microbacterium rhizophilus TaxID=3138934 RepID=UPI0031E62BFD
MTEPTWAGFTYATKRNPARRSRGNKIAEIAGMLGWTPMPWQQHVWDVATELDDDGNYVYERVMVTVPRQSGKTTMFGPVEIHRALEMDGARIYFSAQTGDDARTLMKTLIGRVEASPLRRWIDGKRSAAQTGLVFPPNKSEVWAFPPTADKMHGKTPHLVGLDEIWVWNELQGKELVDDAIVPAQITLRGKRQIWFMSTAGTAESTYMKRLVAMGRRSVTEPGSHPRFAYFEASLPDDADPYDPAAIAAFHPAVGYTQHIDDLMSKVDGRAPEEERVDHATWIRAYCNRWTEAKDPLIPHWDTLADPTIGARRSDIAITWEVAPENAMGAIVATWRDEAGTPCTRVLHAAPGTQWMVDLLVELHDWSPAAFGADDGGPTRRITAEVDRRLRKKYKLGEDDEIPGPGLEMLSGKDRGIADETWLTAARDEKDLIHDGSKTFEHAVDHMVLRNAGEITKISRSHSTGPVAAVIASAVGLHLYDNRPASTWVPVTKY